MNNTAAHIIEAVKRSNNDDDWGDFIDLLDDNVTFRSTIPEGTPISGEFKGKDQVVDYFSNVLPEVASFQQNSPLAFIADKNRVVVLGDDTYQLKKNQKSYRSPYAMVIDFNADRITGILIIQDLTGIYLGYCPQ